MDGEPLVIYTMPNGRTWFDERDQVTYFGFVCYRYNTSEEFICVKMDSRYVEKIGDAPSIFEMLISGGPEIETALALVIGSAESQGLIVSEFGPDNPVAELGDRAEQYFGKAAAHTADRAK